MPFLIDAAILAWVLARTLAAYVFRLGFDTYDVCVYRDVPEPTAVYENDRAGADAHRERVRRRRPPHRVRLKGWSEMTYLPHRHDVEARFAWL